MLDTQVREIRLDPLRKNVRAIHCYKEVGFQAEAEFMTPDGPSLLMTFKCSSYSLCEKFNLTTSTPSWIICLSTSLLEEAGPMVAITLA